MSSTALHDNHRFTVEVDLMIDDGIVVTVSEAEIELLVSEILRREHARGHWAVSIVLTTDDCLRALHRDFMGIDEETDVMTFPSQKVFGHEPKGGEIVVSSERAVEQASEHGHSTEEEFRFLIVHGLLHLCGWTDESPAKREAMLSRQDQLLRQDYDAAVE
ncbi:MAG: rRNA maturation RNase YbeY [Thermomicrobiales bacterium]